METYHYCCPDLADRVDDLVVRMRRGEDPNINDELSYTFVVHQEDLA